MNLKQELRTLKKRINFKREKEFDTKTLFDDLRKKDEKTAKEHIPEKTELNIKEGDKKSDTNEDKSEQTSTIPVNFGSEKPTKIYEPRPLMPGDGMYEDILEQFASAPTKPKYWFEEFGDYWSCSCGHINKGEICKNCGLERKLLKSLFILHKPVGEPGNLNKRLRKTKDQVDREESLQAEKEERRRKLNDMRGDELKVVPIDLDPDAATDNEENTSACGEASVSSAESDEIQTSADADNESQSEIKTDVKDNEKSEINGSDIDDKDETDSNAAQNSGKDEKSESTDAENRKSSNLPATIPANDSTSQEGKNDGNKERKKLSKRTKIIIISVILAAVLAAAGFAAYRYLAAPAIQYEEALKLMDAGKYEKAIDKFEALGDYKDSEEMIWECYIAMGDEQYEAGEFSAAIETYNIAMELKSSDEIREKIRKCYIGIGDNYYSNGEFENALSAYASAQEINDSDNLQEKINQAKFGYVKAYQSDRTDKVEQYMSELMAISYPGIQEIYDEYYAWHVSIIANTSEDDLSNDVSTVSRKDTIYFHSTLSGGEPSEQIELYYEVTWPSGSKQVYNLNQKWSSGSTITARFQYSIPLFGSEGKFTFRLFDRSTGEVLGSDSVTFEN